MTKMIFLFFAAVSLFGLGCSKKSDSTSTTSDPCNVLSFTGAANAAFSATGILTVSPVATASLTAITPLGNLNPPGHIYPTDHMYLVLASSTAGGTNVLAAAAGTVAAITQPAADYKIIIKVDNSFFYYYDHINVASGLAVGSTVTAGQVVGTNSGLAAAVDFGVHNFNGTALTGILNTCLLQSEAYVDSPLKYYPTGATRTALYALAGGQDGQIDYDQAGKLIGNWVLQGHQALESSSVQLAFTHHVASSSLRITVGDSLTGGAAVYGVQVGATDFASVDTGTGQVDYKLYPSSNGDTSVSGTQYGVLSVQMISTSQIKVQIFPGTGSTGTFTSSALYYTR